MRGSNPKGLIALALAALVVPPCASQAETNLREQLEAFAEQNGIAIQGLHQIDENEAGKRITEGSDLRARLKTLLEGYNHVLVADGNSGVERVILLGRVSARDLERLRSLPRRAPERQAQPKSTEPPARATAKPEAQESSTEGEATLERKRAEFRQSRDDLIRRLKRNQR